MNKSSAGLPVSLQTIARLFDDSGSAVFLFDDDDRLAYANAQFYDLIRHPQGTHPTWAEIIRDNHAHNHGLVIEADDVELWIEATLEKRRAQAYRQFEVDAWDGRWFLMTETWTPDVGLLGIGVEITQTVRHSEKLQREYQSAQVEAETDLLTGFGNRRALERLRTLFLREGPQQVTALIIDIDQFKAYNDSLGHSQGDTCLQEIARLIRGSLRMSDTHPIRLGGDEFLVLTPDATISLARQVARRIMNSVRESAIPHPTTESGFVTLSIGFASKTIVDPESFSSLLKEADEALYTAKRSGRDRLEGSE